MLNLTPTRAAEGQNEVPHSLRNLQVLPRHASPIRSSR